MLDKTPAKAILRARAVCRDEQAQNDIRRYMLRPFADGRKTGLYSTRHRVRCKRRKGGIGGRGLDDNRDVLRQKKATMNQVLRLDANTVHVVVAVAVPFCN